jgi:methanogenic corrinoid protein MtbC1
MPGIASAVSEQAFEAYLAGLIAGDRICCTSIVQGLCAAGAGVKDLYLNLFQRALYRIGELWEQHRASVAVEHLATAITERLLTLVQSQVFSAPSRNRSVIISCVAGEFHQLGGRMVADLFEMHGWRAYFLGANTPLEGLLGMIDALQPDLLGLSLSISSNLPLLTPVLDAVTATHPGLPILVGGQAFCSGDTGTFERYPGVTRIASIDDLERAMAAHD